MPVCSTPQGASGPVFSPQNPGQTASGPSCGSPCPSQSILALGKTFAPSLQRDHNSAQPPTGCLVGAEVLLGSSHRPGLKKNGYAFFLVKSTLIILPGEEWDEMKWEREKKTYFLLGVIGAPIYVSDQLINYIKLPIRLLLLICQLPLVNSGFFEVLIEICSSVRLLERKTFTLKF